jgi:hypothetical protein
MIAQVSDFHLVIVVLLHSGIDILAPTIYSLAVTREFQQQSI